MPNGIPWRGGSHMGTAAEAVNATVTLETLVPVPSAQFVVVWDRTPPSRSMWWRLEDAVNPIMYDKSGATIIQNYAHEIDARSRAVPHCLQWRGNTETSKGFVSQRSASTICDVTEVMASMTRVIVRPRAVVWLVICVLSFTTQAFAVVKLSQADFEDGTYLIRQPGTYQLAENITFNPHPPGSRGDEGVTILDAYTAGRPFRSQTRSSRGWKV